MKLVCDLDEATVQVVRAMLSDKEQRVFDSFRGPEGGSKEETFRESLQGDDELGEKSDPSEDLVESFSIIDEAVRQAAMNSLAVVQEQGQEEREQEKGGSEGGQEKASKRNRCKNIVQTWKAAKSWEAAANLAAKRRQEKEALVDSFCMIEDAVQKATLISLKEAAKEETDRLDERQLREGELGENADTEEEQSPKHPVSRLRGSTPTNAPNASR